MPVFNLPSATESAGTLIQQIVPGAAGLIAKINSLTYTSGSTAHTVTILRATASTSVDGRAAADQKVVSLSSPTMRTVNAASTENVAIGDYLAFLDEKGKYVFDVVAGVAGAAMTMTVNLTTAIGDGSAVWIFGEIGRASAIALTPPVSATTTIPLAVAAGIPGQLDTNSRLGTGDPMLISSTNATAAGVIVSVSGDYTSENAMA